MFIVSSNNLKSHGNIELKTIFLMTKNKVHYTMLLVIKTYILVVEMAVGHRALHD